MKRTLLGAVALAGARDRRLLPAARPRSISGTAIPATSASVVQQVCQHFNNSQTDYEVVCTSQGNYDAALQNTIAAFRAGKQPTIVQVFDVGTADLMLSDAYYPAYKLMADNGYKIDWNDYFPGIARYYATSKGEMLVVPLQLLDRPALLEQGRLREDRQDRGARRPGKKPPRT